MLFYILWVYHNLALMLSKCLINMYKFTVQKDFTIKSILSAINTCQEKYLFSFTSFPTKFKNV